MDRKTKLCRLLDVARGTGLEFGPLNQPIVGRTEGDIRYVDMMPTDQLRRHIPASDAYRPEDFVEIDHVWRSPFCDVVGDRRFDYAIAPHVIEHTPNMLGWLNDIASVLEPGAPISLAIPDKRRTLDALRQPTTSGTVVADFLRGETQPRAGAVFDHYLNVVRVPPPGEPWNAFVRGEIAATDLPRYHTPEQALEMARKAEEPGAYTDCHNYVFTPDSFLDVLDTTRRLGLHALSLVDFHGPDPLDWEFFAVLQRS
jgi:hypothetical protein